MRCHFCWGDVSLSNVGTLEHPLVDWKLVINCLFLVYVFKGKTHESNVVIKHD